MSDIGKTIRLARRLRGWTQVELAEKADVHRVTLARIETGDQGLTEGTIKICAVLGLSLDTLMRQREDA